MLTENLNMDHMAKKRNQHLLKDEVSHFSGRIKYAPLVRFNGRIDNEHKVILENRSEDKIKNFSTSVFPHVIKLSLSYMHPPLVALYYQEIYSGLRALKNRQGGDLLEKVFFRDAHKKLKSEYFHLMHQGKSNQALEKLNDAIDLVDKRNAYDDKKELLLIKGMHLHTNLKFLHASFAFLEAASCCDSTAVKIHKGSEKKSKYFLNESGEIYLMAIENLILYCSHNSNLNKSNQSEIVDIIHDFARRAKKAFGTEAKRRQNNFTLDTDNSISVGSLRIPIPSSFYYRDDSKERNLEKVELIKAIQRRLSTYIGEEDNWDFFLQKLKKGQLNSIDRQTFLEQLNNKSESIDQGDFEKIISTLREMDMPEDGLQIIQLRRDIKKGVRSESVVLKLFRMLDESKDSPSKFNVFFNMFVDTISDLPPDERSKLSRLVLNKKYSYLHEGYKELLKYFESGKTDSPQFKIIYPDSVECFNEALAKLPYGDYAIRVGDEYKVLDYKSFHGEARKNLLKYFSKREVFSLVSDHETKLEVSNHFKFEAGDLLLQRIIQALGLDEKDLPDVFKYKGPIKGKTLKELERTLLIFRENVIQMQEENNHKQNKDVRWLESKKRECADNIKNIEAMKKNIVTSISAEKEKTKEIITESLSGDFSALKEEQIFDQISESFRKNLILNIMDLINGIESFLRGRSVYLNKEFFLDLKSIIVSPEFEYIHGKGSYKNWLVGTFCRDERVYKGNIAQEYFDNIYEVYGSILAKVQDDILLLLSEIHKNLNAEQERLTSKMEADKNLYEGIDKSLSDKAKLAETYINEIKRAIDEW